MASIMEDQLFDARVSDLDMWQISKRICKDSRKDLLLEEQVVRQENTQMCTVQKIVCNFVFRCICPDLHNIEDQKAYLKIVRC